MWHGAVDAKLWRMALAEKSEERGGGDGGNGNVDDNGKEAEEGGWSPVPSRCRSPLSSAPTYVVIDTMSALIEIVERAADEWTPSI